MPQDNAGQSREQNHDQYIQRQREFQLPAGAYSISFFTLLAPPHLSLSLVTLSRADGKTVIWL